MLPGRRNATNANPWCFSGTLLLLLLSIALRLEGYAAFTVSGGAVIASGSPRYKLFTARYPLDQGPAQLRLHYVVIVKSVSTPAKPRVWPKKQKEEDGERLVLFDFLPKEPTALPTTLRLLTGGDVEGNLRERELQFMPPGSVCVGESNASLEDMRKFVRAYPERLSLVSNNCFSFVDAFVEMHALNPSLINGGGGSGA